MGSLFLRIQKLDVSQQDPLSVVAKLPQTWQRCPDGQPEMRIALATLGRACLRCPCPGPTHGWDGVGSRAAPPARGLRPSSCSDAPRADITLAGQKG